MLKDSSNHHPHHHGSSPSSSSSSSSSASANGLIRGILIGFALGLATSQIGGFSAQIATNNARSAAALAEIHCHCNCGDGARVTTTTTSVSPLSYKYPAEQPQQQPQQQQSSTTPMIRSAPVAAATTATTSSGAEVASASRSRGLISPDQQQCPFERTTNKEYLPGRFTNSYNYFHDYLNKLGALSPTSPKEFTELPRLHIWPKFFEAYHNHWSRFRGAENVVFMEIGVQSGGKIPMLRDYFGPGLTYIGIDINPSCKMFESAPWVHIEIGNSGDRQFLESIKAKYPKVDIFLDDGGHTMEQQRLAMEVMLPHLQPNGVFACEDLATSWSPGFGGIPWGNANNPDFRSKTMFGLIYRSLEWIQAGWLPGLDAGMTYQMDHPMLANQWQDTPWWKTFAKTVKSVHMYNQLVVYEKGPFEQPYHTLTVGYAIPYGPSGDHGKVNWDPILAKIKGLTKSQW